MEEVKVKASVREEKGKNQCKHLRRDGFVPAVIYKGGKKAIAISVEKKELWHALHTDAGENVIITLEIDAGDKKQKKTVLVQETQLDPVKETMLHVDFHEISLTEKVKVNVPVRVKGEAVGVKEDEGVLTQILWEIEVECMAKDIPEHIDVKVDELRIGDAIHIKDLVLDEATHVLGDVDQVVLSVNPPHVEEEEPVEDEAVEGEEGEPEVIKKGKKEEDGEAEAEEGSKEE